MTPNEEITRAKIFLANNKPFYGYIAFDTPIIEDKNVQTLETDGTWIKYSPEYVSTLTQNKVRGILAHEILHIQLVHMLRMDGRNSDQWNQACDYVVNLILKTEGFELPDDCLLDYKYLNMTAEAVYNLLKDESNPQQKQTENSNDFGGCGRFVRPQGEEGKEASEAEMQKLEQDIRVKVAQSIQIGKRTGTLSSDLEKLISEVIQPRVNWKEKLRRIVNNFSKSDFKWLPPNRRYAYKGLYLPSCKSDSLPTIVIAFDTSGSTWGLIDEFTSELNDIYSQYPISEIIVLYCDSSIKDVESYTQYDLPIKVTFKGGGGTSFVPVFDWIAGNRDDVKLLIYFTDCAGRFPDYEPEYPTIWVKYGRYNIIPPFGEVIEIKDF